jgi:hypothetical protein
MKTAPRLLAAAALLLAAAAPAAADGVRALRLGEGVAGTLEEGVVEAIPFDATANTLLDVDLRMAPGAVPAVAILQPDLVPLPGVAAFQTLDPKGGLLRIRKVPLLASGRHILVVTATVPGAYALSLRGKPPTVLSYAGFVAPAPPTELRIGAVPGALLSVQVKAAKLSALAPAVVEVIAPSGDPLDLDDAALRKTAATSDLVKDLPCPDLGTYTVRVGTQSGLFGDFGAVKVSLKFPKVKKAVVADGDLVVDPRVTAVSPSSGFDNLAYGDVEVSGRFFAPGAALRLEGAATIDATGVEREDDGTVRGDFDLAGRPAGAYDVVVHYPNGAEGRMAGAFTVVATPVATGIAPASGFDNGTASFAVTGASFAPGVAISLVPSGGGSPLAGTVTSPTASSASVSFPLLDAPLGLRDLVVANPDGGTNTLAGAFTVVPGPRFTGATPLLGHDNDGARALSLTGSGFAEGLACTLLKSGETTLVGTVTGLSPTGATATFDLSGKASGNWTLRVANPDGGAATLASPFVLSRAPRTGVPNPARAFDGTTTAGIVVAGTDYVAGAQVALEQAAVATAAATGETVGGGGTTITCDLPLAGAAAGDHDLRVTNPDGGTDLEPAALVVLGRRTLTSGATAAGRPSVAWNDEDGEFLAAYAVHDGTQWDVRARRYSGATGKPLGNEIAITSGTLDSSTTEDQTEPCAVYCPSLDLYLVAYHWKDPAATGDKQKVRTQFVNRDGTLHTDQTYAQTAYTSFSGTIGRPRVAWNATRQEWLFVYAHDVAQVPDILYTSWGAGAVDGNGIRVPQYVGAGTLIATTHQETGGQGSFTVDDRDYDPDVAWSPSANQFLVAHCVDRVEVLLAADATSDVQARVYGGNFASGPSLQATITTLGDVAAKDDLRPSVAAGGGTYLVAWDHLGTAGNRDVRCWLVNAATRAKIGASPTTVEETAGTDASHPAVAFDGTASANGYLVAHALGGGTAGASSIAATRLPLSAGPVLGTATYRTLAAAAANASFTLPAAAARASAGEYLAAWAASGSGADPADAEVRFAK